MKIFILGFLLFPTLSYSQEIEDIILEDSTDPLELDVVEVESNSLNNISSNSIIALEDISYISSKIEDYKDFSVKQYTSSDIVIDFHNVTLNNSADNKVELYHYPKYLLRNITLSDRVAFGPTYSFKEDDIEGNILFNIQATTIKDFELYSQFKSEYLSGLFFGNITKGEFEFTNSKNEDQVRENNKHQRLGFSLYNTYLFSTTVFQPFFYYSTYTRGVGGFSEFPQWYKEAEETGNLVLLNMSTYSLFGIIEIDTSLSYRYQTYSYKNPHSKYPKDSNVYTEDNSLEIQSKIKYPINRFILSGELKYSFSDYIDNTRNVFTVNPSVDFTYLDFSVSLQIPILISQDTYPQYSLSLQYKYDSFQVALLNSRLIRLPTFNELYFRNEFIHGDKNLKPQIDNKTTLLLSYTYDNIVHLSLSGSYSYLQDLIRYTQDTANLFVVHNIPNVHVVNITPSISVNYDVFVLSTSYSYNYSKVKDLYELPLLSKHEFHISTGIESDIYKAKLIYTYSSPKYLHFSNTTESLSDSNLSMELSYRYSFLETSVVFDNILNSRRETSIQFPLPGFNASFNLKINL